MIRKIMILSLMLVSLSGLTACDSEPPTLMKASKQFETDEIRDRHIAYMRINHMDALKHKRDETMYKGIRTKKNSINACIDCHVPDSYKGKVLRHTDQEHFCTTCHTYVAAKLDCFECHIDHPVKEQIAEQSDTTINIKENTADTDNAKLNQLSSMGHQELVDLVFKHSKGTIKQPKSVGVSFSSNTQSNIKIEATEATNE